MKVCRSRQFSEAIINSCLHKKKIALHEISNDFLFDNLFIIKFFNAEFILDLFLSCT